jgi:hypothetical protein
MTALRRWSRVLAFLVPIFAVSAFTYHTAPKSQGGSPVLSKEKRAQVAYGRYVVITHDCGGCHGGDGNPADPHWLQGTWSPIQEFKIGPAQSRRARSPAGPRVRAT